MQQELLDEIRRVRESSELLYDRAQLSACLDLLATDVTAKLRADNPIFLCVMNGAVPAYAELLSRLDFPLETGYLQATRYRGTLSGDQLQWLVRPGDEVKGRTVVIVDDILDEGITLAGIKSELEAMGAARVSTLVMVKKLLSIPAATEADFVGLTVPDRYVFGFGMDYKGYWRNLPAIYAVQE